MVDAVHGPQYQNATAAETREYSPLPDREVPTERITRRKDPHAVRRERDQNELSQVLSHGAGQGLVLRILGFCDPTELSIQFGQPDVSAFNEGKRAVGSWLIKELRAIDPELYPKLLLQHLERERAMMAATDTRP